MHEYYKTCMGRKRWSIHCWLKRVGERAEGHSEMPSIAVTLRTGRTVLVQDGPDSIRQFLIISNNQSIQQHTGKLESTFCCR
jgi:hypothetical protein